MADIGEVFHDPNFVFQDGERGNKLFIILAVGAICIVARTTSKSSGKSRSYGCHNEDRFPNFFIPQEAAIFPEDTWVCLDYLVEFKQPDFEHKVKQGNIRKITLLGMRLLLDLLECAITSDDATAAQEHVLRISLEKIKT